MKIIKYISCVLILGVLYAILYPFNTLNPVEISLWRVLLGLLLVVSPTLAVMFAEVIGIKKLCRQYLSFRQINWVLSVKMLIIVAVAYPLLALIIALARKVMGIAPCEEISLTCSPFAPLFKGNNPQWIAGIYMVVTGMIATFVVSPINALSNVCSEIGWRGFMQQRLKVKETLKPLAIGIVWSLWVLSTKIVLDLNAEIICGQFAYYIALSYLLSTVVEKAGSVWISAAMIGVIEWSSAFGIVDVSSWYSKALIIVMLIGVILLMTRQKQ